MRRADREITDIAEIEKILEQAQIIRLAMVDEGSPYLVAMNFVYRDHALYMHSAKEGRKIDILKKNNRVAFQTETCAELLLAKDAWNCSTRYQSVFGTGRALLVDDKEGKQQALDAIMAKHKRGNTEKAEYEYPEKVFDRTLVIKVEIESMTGKKSG